MAVYLKKLKGVAGNCNFGTQLDDRLRDQLACGLSNANTLKKCLTLPLSELTVTKAIDIAQADKTVRSGQRQWLGEESGNILNNQAAEVHHIQQRNKNSHKLAITKCLVCGRAGHYRADCRFKRATCVNATNKVTCKQIVDGMQRMRSAAIRIGHQSRSTMISRILFLELVVENFINKSILTVC